MSIFMYFCQKSCCTTTVLTPTLLLGFTVFSDNPMVGEVRLGDGPQSGVAPVRIPISFWSRVT
jgi:hypothetical protein